MTVDKYISTYFQFADQIHKKYGVPVEVSLAQSALESGWGKYAPNNMMFGIKTGSSWKGKKQLITTTEYHKTKDVKYPEIISIEKYSTSLYKYRVKDWFRAYDSPAGSFEDYAKLLQNTRYKNAFNYKNDSYQFIAEVAKGGYSTSPTYTDYMKGMINTIKNGLKKKPELYQSLPH